MSNPFDFNAPEYYDFENPENNALKSNTEDVSFFMNHQKDQEPDSQTSFNYGIMGENEDDDTTMANEYDNKKSSHIQDVLDMEENQENQYPNEDVHNILSSPLGLKTAVHLTLPKKTSTPLRTSLRIEYAPKEELRVLHEKVISTPSEILPRFTTNIGFARKQPKKKTMSSTLMKPTLAYLAKKEARDKYMMDSTTSKALHKATYRNKALTVPTSPKLHVYKSKDRGESSTSRELKTIQKETMEWRKTKFVHDKYRKSHTMPCVYPIVEKKGLTKPVAPMLSTLKRLGQLKLSNGSKEEGVIHAEALVCRPLHTSMPVSASLPFKLTHAASPRLQTGARAKMKAPKTIPAPETPVAKKSAPCLSLTMAQSPMLLTSSRASMQNTVRHFAPAVDEDSIEMAKQFKARPVTKNSRLNPSLIQPKGGRRTVAQSPNLSTRNRIRSFDTVSTNQERVVPTTPPRSNKPLTLTVAKTPKLKSLLRHAEYKTRMEADRVAEEARESSARRFKAAPIRVGKQIAIHPSTAPLTETRPFSFRGDRFHAAAEEKQRMEQARMEEARLRDATVHAHALPHFTSFVPVPSSKPLTAASSPILASKEQAKKRHLYQMAYAARREEENVFSATAANLAALAEKAEIDELRRTTMQFHAHPVSGKEEVFHVMPSEKELTVPQSPLFTPSVSSSK